MDEGTTITLKKRPRSSGEASNSFIQNVTSTVSNIFSPFVKWLSSPNASTDNDLSQKVDATDSSSEEEVSPPTKKMCYNSTENSNHIGQSGVLYPTSNMGANTSPVKNLNKVYHVSSSNHSNTQELPEDNNEGDYKNTEFDTPQFNATTSRQSVIKKRKSLFNTIDEKSSDLSKNKKTEIAVKDSYGTVKATSLGSPFYPGKTSYGGASACYMNRLNVDVLKTPINKSSSRFDDSCMSQSAKRVMKLLEDYSSPLSEARRISQCISSKKHDNLNTRTQSNKSRSYKTQELHIPSIASILSLEKKNKISSLMDTTKHARQIFASHSSTKHHEPYPQKNIQSDLSNRNSDKYVTKITKKNMGHMCINTSVELPPAILEIDQSNLQNLDFGISTVSEDLNSSVAISMAKSAENSSNISSDNKINDDADQNINMEEQTESKQLTNNYQYQFSMPLVVLNDTLNSSIPKTLSDNPQQNKEKTEVIVQDFSVPIVQPLEIDNEIVKQKLEEWKCSDCWVNNKADASNCVCCSAKKPVGENKTSYKCSSCEHEIRQDSVGNLCTKCEIAQETSNNSPLPSPSEKRLSWKCNDCWVKNDALVEKCICCGGKRPESKDNENKTNEQKFTDNRDYKISTFNTCDEVQPGHNSDSIPVTLPEPNNDVSSFKIQDNIYENIVKAQSNMWECPYCLANNNNNASKCICCEAGKPNTGDTKIKQFCFSASPSTFKFGIDHNAKCDSSKNIEAEQMSINEEWETNNNVLDKTSSFNFGSSKTTDDKKENFVTNNFNNTPEVPKLNFKFGISNQSSIDQPKSSNLLKCDGIQQETEFTLTSTAKCPDVSKQNMGFLAVPEVLNCDNVPQDSTFKIPLSSSALVETQLNPVPDDVVRHNTLIEDKNSTFKPITIESIENNEVNTPNALSFCNSGIRIATNLYNTQSGTETIAVTSVNSLISSSMTNTVSLLEKNDNSSVSETSMFQKMNTIPMFQITETSKPAETTLSHSSSKLFNFGHNNKNSISLPETPKFNFNFGNVKKTESPQMFSPTFDITNNSNPLMNSNNFTFTTGNMVGTNLSLPVSSLCNENINMGNSITNNLPGPNGIPTANPLEINESSMSVGQNFKLSNNLPITVPMFDESIQKDNLWTNTKNNFTNMFVTNTNTNNLQMTPTFSFGIPTPLQATNNGPIFGNSNPNIFPMQNPTPSMPSLFQSPNLNPPTPNIFGNMQSPNAPVSVDGVFHHSDMSVANNFSIPSPTMPTFETHSQISRPTQSFNFGTPQQTSGVFGFGQQPGQPFQNAVYNFGCNQNVPQFAMGSSHNTSVRRVRKAVRRSTQR